MPTILVVEDDTELRELFCVVLGSHGYDVAAARDAAEALDALGREHLDLMVTDIMMPGMDGIELASAVRAAGYDLPIIVVTALGDLGEKRRGFAAGVDDYVVKPVDVNELTWRVEALLRRARVTSARQIHVGETVIDRDALTVTRAGTGGLPDKVAELPQKEFNLLFKLMGSPGRIFTRRQLMDEVWGIESEADPHTLDVHISRLRERFRDNPDFEIVTVRGLGYKGMVCDAAR